MLTPTSAMTACRGDDAFCAKVFHGWRHNELARHEKTVSDAVHNKVTCDVLIKVRPEHMPSRCLMPV
jgi:hypothetical protein